MRFLNLVSFAREIERRRRLLETMREALKKTDSVLFVCKGNKYRGPFAEKLAARFFPKGIEVSSAATQEEVNLPSPASAIEVAREFGIDLSAHRSRRITAEQALRAGVILIFQENQRAWFKENYPQFLEKVFPLGLFESTLDYSIGDHRGYHVDKVWRAYRRIERCLKKASLILERSGEEGGKPR